MALSTAITPVLRYRDAGAAARWLCGAFGFHELDRAQELDGRVRYVSLRLGDSVVLVRPIASSALDDLMVQPEAIGGANTQTCYLTIPDVADHHARAEGAGAKVVIEPQDDGLGGRFYTCRDLEGHLWSFGTRTYGVAQQVASAFEPAELDPSQPSTSIASPQRPIARQAERRRRLLRDIAIAAAAAILVSGGWPTTTPTQEVASEKRRPHPRRQPPVSRMRSSSWRKSAAADWLRRRTPRRRRRDWPRSAPLSPSFDRPRNVQAPDLADMRRQKDEAARALQSAERLLSQKHQLARERAEAQVAAAKVQIAGAEAKLARASEETAEAARVQLAKEQSVDAALKEELQEAKTALIEANRKIEELRAGLSRWFPTAATRVAESSSCVLAVQGKIPASHKGPTTWPAVNLGRLCRGAERRWSPRSASSRSCAERSTGVPARSGQRRMPWRSAAERATHAGPSTASAGRSPRARPGRSPSGNARANR